MKKELCKVLRKFLMLLLGIVLFTIVLYYVRQYYDIPFFVVFGISIICIFFVCLAHTIVEEYFTIHSFFNMNSEITQSSIIKKLKPIINHPLCILLQVVCASIVYGVQLYKFYCYEDFMSNTIMLITYIIALIFSLLNALITKRDIHVLAFVCILSILILM